MIKTIAKVFAFTSIFKNLVLTQKSKTEGITQLHPIKIPGRTVFVREKEYFIRETLLRAQYQLFFCIVGVLTHLGVGLMFFLKLKMLVHL